MIPIQIQNDEKQKKWMKHLSEYHYIAGMICFFDLQLIYEIHSDGNV